MSRALPETRIPKTRAHGGDGAAIAAALGLDPDSMLDLSLSLNPVAPDPVPVVARHIGEIRRYPDPTEATEALASSMGVEAGRLLLTNGGAEAISLVTAELGGRVREPEFALHPRTSGPRWRSNPHSPSGLLAGPSESADIWDEAFFPLATGQWTRGDRGTVVVGSLTKLFACPGLRLGYVVGEPDLIARCSLRQAGWPVNSLAVAALPDFLVTADLPAWSKAIRTLRTQLVEELERHGLPVRPSDANWVLVDHAGLREQLAPHGIVVRDCSNFGMPTVARIAVPSPDGLLRLTTTLGTVELDVQPRSRQQTSDPRPHP